MTTLSTYQQRIEDARERVDRDIADHELTVLHDDGLYRHLRFQRPGDSAYWFDIVTWPGVLTVSGDCGCFTFSRIRDMLDFFESYDYGINPDYWSQKLRAPDSRAVRVFDIEEYKRHVRDWLSDYVESYDLDDAEAAQLRCAVEEQLLDYLDEVDESEAHRRLRDFQHGQITISDSWEWDMREYDGWFLWNCWAIVRGIAMYRALAPAETHGEGS